MLARHLAILAAVALNETGAGARRSVRRRLLSSGAPAALTIGLLGLTAAPAAAQDATWIANPTIALGLSNFNVATNWNPATVPTGTASFGFSNGTQILLSAATTVGGLTFNAGASNYTIFNNTLGLGGNVLTITGAGVIVNGGSFDNVIGADSQTLFQNSSSAGSATYDVGGTLATLSFQNSSTAATSTINASSGAIFLFSGTSTAASSSITNGSGASLTFADNTTAANSTIVNTGSMTFRDASTAANATITNNSGGVITISSTAGSAAIGNNSGATLSFTSTGTAGNAAITNAAGAVNFNNSSTAGSATINNNNNASLSFGDTSTGGSATINNNFGGSLTFLNNSTGGTAHITNNASANAFFNNSATGGNAIVTNAGTLTFEDTSTAGNASITNNHNLNFLNTATAGNASITNNSVMSFRTGSTGGSASITNNATLGFFNNSTGGNASIVNAVAGTVDFSSSTGPAGDSKLSVGSIAGAGFYYLGSRQLTVGGNNTSTTVSGIISDCGATGLLCNATPATGGSLVKTGTGALTLTGANTYTGGTTVNGGTLFVNGAIVSSSTVNAGGTLAGTGTVGNVQVTGGGVFAPGSGTAGTAMTIAGNLTMGLGAIYQVAVNPAAASSATVTGTANINNSTASAQFASGSYISKTYTILTAGNVSGTFVGLATANLPSNFGASLSYDATHAYLNLNLGFSSTTGAGGIGGIGGAGAGGGTGTASGGNNQANTATTLVHFFNRTGGIASVFATLTPAGLTQVSGEPATGSQQTTFQAMNQFMGLLTDPFIGRGNGVSAGTSRTGFADENEDVNAANPNSNDALALFEKAARPAPFVQRWSVWAAGYGGSQATSGNVQAASNDARSSVFGTAVGADYLFSPDTLLGFAVAGGGTNFSVNNLGGGRSDLFQAGAYARHVEGNAYITGALAYGWQDITTNRTVTVAGLDQLRAQFHANAYSGRVEGGYRFVAPALGGFGITPYAAGQFTTFDLPTYAETAVIGTPTFALAYTARSAIDTRSELGVRGDRSFAMPEGIVTLRSRLAWAHDFDPDRSIAATFQALPGASFVVNGAAPARESALTTASVEMKWLNGWSAAATFEGEFSKVTESYAGKGVVRYAW